MTKNIVLKNKHNQCPDCKCYDREGKICSICKEAKPVEEFRLKKDGYMMSYCLPCELEWAKSYGATAREKQKAKRQAELDELERLRKLVKDHGLTEE